MMEIIMEEWCRFPPIEFQTVVEPMPRCIDAILVARVYPTPLVPNSMRAFKKVEWIPGS
jgi:hypothetical protein